jgi:glutathione S-transferase
LRQEFGGSCGRLEQDKAKAGRQTKGKASMSLTLYYHPLSSYCQKVLIALYENATPFTPLLIDLHDPDSRAKLTKVWPIGKFPVLQDGDWTVPESSIIIEYLARHYPGPVKLLPDDPDLARRTRMVDRFYDLHIDDQMAKIVGDRWRPDGQHDPYGVTQARERLKIALGMVEEDMAKRQWAMGDDFGMADCAAAPALFYANMVMPFRETHRSAARYLDRLMGRPSYARVLKEAEPYLKLMQGG